MKVQTKHIKQVKYLSLLILFSILLTFLVGCSPFSQDQYLTIHVIDVGQGDSILISTPNQHNILIDGGDPTQGHRVVSYLKRHKIKNVDIIIATHPHADHIGGLIDVMENFSVDSLYLPPKSHNSQIFERFLLTAQQHDISLHSVQDAFSIALEDDIKLHFISPFKDYGDNLNLWSIVMKLEYHHMNFLFTGDIENEAESDLIKKYDSSFLASHFLKVPHHGSNTSSTANFLDTVNPDVAVIPVGQNNLYGHPHGEVLQRLKDRGIQYYRTDYQGTIIFQSDGEEIWSFQEPYFSNR